jgi:hypothetical protein
MTIGINLLLTLFLFLGCLHTIVRISLYRFYVILTIRVIKYGDVECLGWGDNFASISWVINTYFQSFGPRFLTKGAKTYMAGNDVLYG